MNRWPFRWKIAALFSVLATVVILGVGLYIHTVVVSDQQRILRRELVAQTRLATGSLQDIADQIDRQSGARVTVIGADGTVLADSRERPADMESHADRPERLEALRDGSGVARRHSATLGIDMLYAAQKLPESADTVVRLALPLSEVQATARRVEGSILIALVVAVVLILVVSVWLGARLSAPIDQLVRIARRPGRGDLQARSDIQSGGLAELALALNESLDQLQKRVETSEREARHYSAILAQMTDGVVVIDPDGRVRFINEAFARLFDVSEENVEGQFVAEITLNYELSVLLTRAAEQGTMQRGEVRVLHPEPRELIAVATPLHAAEKTLTGVVALLHDATEILRMDQVRRDFVANASHELRTPATSIKAMADVLAAGAMHDQERGPVFIQRVIDAADRLTRLLDDMLTLTRVERGQELLNPEWIDVSSSFREALAHIRAAAESAGISLEMELTGDGGLHADPSSLQTILINLLENAVKYTGTGGHVLLTGKPVPGGYQVSVIDDGIGIPRNELPRIFERFYRIDRARGRDTGGTGLGLAIAKNIAEAHGGDVKVRSTPGEGSTFAVFFPAPANDTG